MIGTQSSLDFSVVFHAILDGLRELRHIVLGGIGSTINVVLGSSSEDSTEGLHGKSGTAIIEALDDGSGISEVSLFEETVEELLEGISVITINSHAISKDSLEDGTSFVTNLVVLASLEIVIGLNSSLVEGEDMGKGILFDLLLDFLGSQTSQMVSSEGGLDFSIVLHAILDRLGKLGNVVLGGIGSTIDIVLGGSSEDSTEGLHGKSGTAIIEALDDGSGISKTSLFEETVEELLEGISIIAINSHAISEDSLEDGTSFVTDLVVVSSLEVVIGLNSSLVEGEDVGKSVLFDLLLDFLRG
jgi:uncharacterized membrane protein YeaQ/YmgE (transglycosylase-associated protein family)